MTSALIGHTGYVGTTLKKQTSFDLLYRASNIAEISGRELDFVVCAAAPAQKWIANREPDADRRNIQALIDHLRTIKCGRFVLISTVDVFKSAVGVHESTVVDQAGLHPYGLHRFALEEAVKEHFPDHLIVRLPGLVGPGLRKNVIFDFLNDNNLHAIDSRGVFQFYPMVNLWYDLQTALAAGLTLVHLTAEPISVAEVAEAFGRRFQQALASSPARYDFRSEHARLFGGAGEYQYQKREVIQAIRAYAQYEVRTLPAQQGPAS